MLPSSCSPNSRAAWAVSWNWKLVVWWIGTATEPVVGSARWLPPCRARVSGLVQTGFDIGFLQGPPTGPSGGSRAISGGGTEGGPPDRTVIHHAVVVAEGRNETLSRRRGWRYRSGMRLLVLLLLLISAAP